MKLQAVLLFVCISTAYGMMCKHGGVGRGVVLAQMVVQEGITITECGEDTTMCARFEFKIGSATGTTYGCGGDSCEFVGCVEESADANGERIVGKYCCFSTTVGTLLTIIIALMGLL